MVKFLAFVSRKEVTTSYIILFLLAISVRSIYLYFFLKESTLQLLILDSEYYFEWAEKIAGGEVIGKNIFFTEPLYAYFISIFVNLFPVNWQYFVIIFQLILGSIIPLLIYAIAKKLFNFHIAFLAGLIAALYGPFIFYESLILKTSVETFLILLFTILFLKAIETEDGIRKKLKKQIIFSQFLSRKSNLFILSGVILGLSVLTKGNSLILVPLVIGFITLKPNLPNSLKIKNPLLFMAGVTLIILPVTIRNYYAGNDFVLTNYSFGMNFYQGNFIGSDGMTKQPAFIRPNPQFEEMDSRNEAEKQLSRKLKPSEISGYWVGRTISEIVSNPKNFVSLLTRKLLLLLSTTESNDNYSYAYFKSKIPILPFLSSSIFIIPATILGLLMACMKIKKDFTNFNRNKLQKLNASSYQLSAIVLITFSYVFTIILGHVNARYRIPIMPFLIIFGVFFYNRVWEIIKEKGWIKLIVIIYFFLVIIYISLFYSPVDNPDYYQKAVDKLSSLNK